MIWQIQLLIFAFLIFKSRFRTAVSTLGIGTPSMIFAHVNFFVNFGRVFDFSVDFATFQVFISTFYFLTLKGCVGYQH